MSLSFFIGSVIGFILFFISTHPSHPKSINRILPSIHIGRVEVCPRIRIQVKGYRIWFHHWLMISFLYFLIATYAADILVAHATLHGLIVGGISQGLTYRDRFHIVKRVTISQEKFSYSHQQA